uniref:Uncharacterized protein n=1 Tax=Heliothis virescens TaxID=7102 RepID=A0A2A4IY57_HELVI
MRCTPSKSSDSLSDRSAIEARQLLRELGCLDGHDNLTAARHYTLAKLPIGFLIAILTDHAIEAEATTCASSAVSTDTTNLTRSATILAKLPIEAEALLRELFSTDTKQPLATILSQVPK